MRKALRKSNKVRPPWAARLEKLREHTGLNQEGFAKTIGLASQQAYSYYETGDAQLNSELCLKIREKYGISLDWLIAGNEPVTSTIQVPVEWKPADSRAARALLLSEMIAALSKDPELFQSDRPSADQPQPKSQDRSADAPKPGKPSPRKT